MKSLVYKTPVASVASAEALVVRIVAVGQNSDHTKNLRKDEPVVPLSVSSVQQHAWSAF